MNYKC